MSYMHFTICTKTALQLLLPFRYLPGGLAFTCSSSRWAEATPRSSRSSEALVAWRALARWEAIRRAAPLYAHCTCLPHASTTYHAALGTGISCVKMRCARKLTGPRLQLRLDPRMYVLCYACRATPRRACVSRRPRPSRQAVPHPADLVLRRGGGAPTSFGALASL